MSDRDRLEQLQVLAGRLALMPASAERDWMLAEVRARAVDVETGVMPAALRAGPTGGAKEETAAPFPPVRGARRRNPAPAPPSRRATHAVAPRPLPARPRAAHESAVNL